MAARAEAEPRPPSLAAAGRGTASRSARRGPADPGELFLEVADAFERKGDLAQQLRIYREFIERFGDDPTQSRRVIQALAKTAEVHRRVGNRKDAQRAWHRLIQAYHRRGIGPDVPEVRHLAEAVFWLGDDDFQAFMAAHLEVKPLTGGSKRRRQKALKLNREAERALMGRVAPLLSHYDAVIDHDSPGWTVAALYRVGRIHQRLAQVLVAAPNPYPTADERSAAHRASIERRATELRGAALKAFERAYAEATAHRVANEWARKVFQALHAAKPRDYPLEREDRRLRALP